MVTNEDRADWAVEALDAFCQATFSRDFTQVLEDEKDAGVPIGDLLCDLMHLCVLSGWSFDEFVERARDHHEEELAEELAELEEEQ